MAPSRDSEDRERNLLAAQEEDVQSILEEAVLILILDYNQAEVMEHFLNLAWFVGGNSSREQAKGPEPDSDPNAPSVVFHNLKEDFKALMHTSAESLNLTVGDTVIMWNYLQDAWMAGFRACEAEMKTIYLEEESDVGGEASDWLEENDQKR